MKIFIINLPVRTDRRAFMEKQIQRFNLDAEFIEAVDGKNLTPEEATLYDEQLALKKNGKKLSPGELGCALSHRKVYEKIVKENIPEALVFEDDVSFDENLLSLLNNKKALTDTSWTWLQIDYPLINIGSWFRSSLSHIRQNPFFVLYVLLKFPYIVSLCVFERIRNKIVNPRTPKTVSVLRPLYFASCYIVSKKGAEILLDLATPIRYPADRLPNQARLKKGFIMKTVVPLLVHQERTVFVSDIG